MAPGWAGFSIEKQRQHDSMHEPVDVRAIRPGPVQVRQAVEPLALVGVNVVFRRLQATSALCDAEGVDPAREVRADLAVTPELLHDQTPHQRPHLWLSVAATQLNHATSEECNVVVV